MAETVVIDIEAELKDNASAGIDALSKKVDELNGKKITISADAVSGEVEKVGKTIQKAKRSITDYGDPAKTNIMTRRTEARMTNRAPITKVNANRIGQEVTSAISRAAGTAKMSVNAEITGKAGDIFNGKTIKIRTEPVGTSKDWMHRDGIYGSGYYSRKAAISDMASRAASAAEYMPSSDLGARETSGYNPHRAYTATEMLGDKSGMLQLANIGGEKQPYLYNKPISLRTERFGSSKKWYPGSDDTKKILYGGQETAMAVSDFGDTVNNIGKTLRKQTEEVKNITNSGSSQNKRALTSFANSMARAAAVSAFRSAGSDILDGMSNENPIDSRNAAQRGLVKGGIVGAGALIGTAFGMPMIGAGVGGLVAQTMGDDMWGLQKSAEQIRQEALDKYFGNVAIAMDDVLSVAKNLSGIDNFSSKISFSDSLKGAADMRTRLQGVTGDLKSLGSVINFNNAMQSPVPAEHLERYTRSISDFTSSAKDYLNTQWLNNLYSVDDLFGSGNNMVESISNRYSGAVKDITNYENELGNMINKYMEDGQLDMTETAGIQDIVVKMKGIIDDITIAESAIDLDNYHFLAKNGLISEDSFGNVFNQVGAGFDDRINDLFREMNVAIRAGTDPAQASASAWGKAVPLITQKKDNQLALQYEMFGNEFNTGREAYAGKANEFFNYLSGMSGNDLANVDKALNNGGKYTLNGNPQGLSQAMGMNQIGDYSREIMKKNYDMHDVSGLERQAQAAMAANAPGAEGLLYRLADIYEMGAMGGDASALQKYAGMKMASDRDASAFMDGLISTGKATKYFDQSLLDSYAFARNGYNDAGFGTRPEIGSNNNPLGRNIQPDKVENTGMETQNALNKSGTAIERGAAAFGQKNQDASETFATGRERWGESTNKFTNGAAQNIVQQGDRLASDIMSALGSSFGSMDTSALGKMDIGQNMMNAIGSSITNMDASVFGNLNIGNQLMDFLNYSMTSMDVSSLGSLPIGETVMSAIGSSISNMDSSMFGNLNIGNQLMDSINFSLSNMDASALGSLPIGETLMSAIGNSITNMDMTALPEFNIGESIMNSISSSIATIDVSSMPEMNIGQNIMNSINESIGSIEAGGIGEMLQSQISASMESITVEAAITVNPTYELSDGGAGIMEQLSALSAYAEVPVMINAMDNVTPIAAAATAAINSIPTGWHTNLTCSDGISGPASAAAAAVNSIPTSKHVTLSFTQIGSLPSIGGHATGGIVSGRQLSWVGEERPEAIIPLVNSRRDRGIDLWMQTGRMLGVMENAEGGIYGNTSYYNPLITDDAPIADNESYASGLSVGNDIKVDIGGINFVVQNSGDNDVVQTIRDNYSEIASEVVSKINERLGDGFANTPIKN